MPLVLVPVKFKMVCVGPEPRRVTLEAIDTSELLSLYVPGFSSTVWPDGQDERADWICAMVTDWE
jgi:hypothetical protein